jgi:uncharacterized protein (UPF0333 family)
METKKRAQMPTVGGTSLLVIFAILCLTTFAVLSIATGEADTSQSRVSAEAVKAFYDADLEAEEIFSRIRAGEMPEGVSLNGNVYSYTCKISETQVLFVEIKAEGDRFTVLRWQAASLNT